ncbi:MAG: hypothetical protein ACLSH6_10795 [Limosilactobacillus pontis]
MIIFTQRSPAADRSIFKRIVVLEEAGTRLKKNNNANSNSRSYNRQCACDDAKDKTVTSIDKQEYL